MKGEGKLEKAGVGILTGCPPSSHMMGAVREGGPTPAYQTWHGHLCTCSMGGYKAADAPVLIPPAISSANPARVVIEGGRERAGRDAWPITYNVQAGCSRLGPLCSPHPTPHPTTSLPPSAPQPHDECRPGFSQTWPFVGPERAFCIIPSPPPCP